MFANTLLEELTGRGAAVVFGLMLGGLIGWLISHWRRMRERRSVLRGDARDTIVIHQHIVESTEIPDPDGRGTRRVPTLLRIRALGQAELNHVIPNGHLASVLLHRAFQVTPHDTLVSMEGAEGSYLLETLTGFVCDRTANAAFEHGLYVMAACCEPAELAQFQPVTLILIRLEDLPLFESWTACRGVRVEHGSEGSRVLTLMEMARRFRSEQEKIKQLRQGGRRTRHVETMYILDLALDPRATAIPTKDVPWGRFEAVLKRMNLE